MISKFIASLPYQFGLTLLVACGTAYSLPIQPATATGSLWLKPDGTLFTVNWSDYQPAGQYISDRSLPPEVLSAIPWARIGAGERHELAIKIDGTLWAWGQNRCGQLGIGNVQRQKEPTLVGTDRDWVQAAGGRCHTLALKADGSLWAWGLNSDGQLGNGSLTQQVTPVKIGEGFASIAARSNHSFAIKTDGSLWAWGENQYGQLGTGSTRSEHRPTLVGNGYSQVSAGSYHTVAIKTDGSLWSWGGNFRGQLGDGTTTQRMQPVLVGQGFKQVAAGGYHTLAIKSDGSRWGWGANDFSQLGNGRRGPGNQTSPERVDQYQQWEGVDATFFSSTFRWNQDEFITSVGSDTTSQLSRIMLPESYPIRFDYSLAGTGNDRTLTIRFRPKGSDLGKPIKIYLGVDRLGALKMSNGSQFEWYQGGALPVFQTVTLSPFANIFEVQIKPADQGVRMEDGPWQLIVGYGSSEAEMLEKRQYRYLFDFNR